MTIPSYLHKPMYSLLLVFISIEGCYGQTTSPLVRQTITTSPAQPHLVKTQGSREGDNVWCGLQDKAGFLWFGTTGEGVYRYDGKMFTQFTVRSGLTSNVVYSILEDNSGNI